MVRLNCVLACAIAVAAAHARVRREAERGLARYRTDVLFPAEDARADAWAWTDKEPGEGWRDVGFDDSAWRRSAGGIGSGEPDAPHRAAVRTTTVKAKTLWIRRRFAATEKGRGEQGRAGLRLFRRLPCFRLKKWQGILYNARDDATIR